MKSQQTGRVATDGQPFATDGQPFATDRTSAIVAYIAKHGRAGVSDLAIVLGLSKDRTRAIVRGLAAEGVLAKHGNGRYTYYTLRG